MPRNTLRYTIDTWAIFIISALLYSAVHGGSTGYFFKKNKLGLRDSIRHNNRGSH